MKLSERWLREMADPGVDSGALAERLTAAGLEVDSVEPVAGGIEGVVVGEVLAAEPHPDAERLRVCRVQAGDGDPLDVVCGAPNVHAGMRAPMALPGARLPGGVKIRKSRIRGVQSNGMLCSARELGLGDEADGILALPDDAPIGRDLADYLALDDRCIDIDLTPNRGDCLGVLGIARDVSALFAVPLVEPPDEAVPAADDADVVPITLDAPADCPRYIGRIIRGIDPRAVTPVWMRERLRRSGVRAISPVVDVTNYVMLELGQPMHAFDLHALDRGIRVRRAREGERLTLLDGAELTLDGGALVIADETRPVALAGVMGGLDSAVGEETRDILLECAWFNPLTIAAEARRRGLHTDASHRYERGVATDLQRRATERATRLLVDVAGGAPGPLIESVEPGSLPAAAPIRLRASRVHRLLGVAVPADDVAEVLERLGMAVEPDGEGVWRVTPPAHRSDVTIEADLIEEVARVRGFDTVPEHTPAARLDLAPLPESRVHERRVRRLLVERDYQEAITYSFVSPDLQAALDPELAPIPLSNPISAELAVMRTTLWPGLLGALLHNVKRQMPRVRLFEVGLTFREEGNRLRQEPAVGGVATGPAVPVQWGARAADCDFYDVKGDVEALLDLTGRGEEFRFEPGSHPALHPGQCARIERDGAPAGWLGALHPRWARAWKLTAPVYLFQLEMSALAAGHLPRFEALSKYPAVRRDIAVIVDESVSAADVRACVGQAGVHVLKNLELFDVYRGEGIDSGRKSIALGLTFQDDSRTLADAEIDASVGAIVEALEGRLGGQLRG